MRGDLGLGKVLWGDLGKLYLQIGDNFREKPFFLLLTNQSLKYIVLPSLPSC